MKNNSIKNLKAFTLIELLVVISIIGLLSSVVMVSLASAREKGRIGSIIKFDTYNYRKLGSNLIAGYDFDDLNIPGKDSSGNGYDLTLSGATRDTSVVYNGSGGSLKIDNDGYYAYKDLGTSVSLLRQDSKGFSISAWTYKDNLNIGNDIAISLLDSVSGIYNKNIFCAATGNLIFNLFSSSGGGFTGGQTNSPVCKDIGVWHNFVLSYNNTPGSYNFSVFVDGKLITQSNPTSAYPYTSISSIYIGNNVNSTHSDGFRGHIDSVRIYNESLTASEVGKIYAEGLKTHQLAEAK